MAFDTGGVPQVLPLTWGQERLLRIIEQIRPSHNTLNLYFGAWLEEGKSLDEVAQTIRHFVEIHESLRTLVTKSNGEPCQVVYPTGQLDLDIVDAAADMDRETVVHLIRQLAAPPFDETRDWPLRAAVVLAAGKPRYLACVVSHLAIDLHGVPPLRQALRLLSKGERLPSEKTMHPRQITLWESSPTGDARGQRAVARHRAALAQMPQSMFPRLGETGGEQPRYPYLRLSSSALAVATNWVAAHHRTSETAVIFAALAAVVAHVSCLESVLFQICVSNRTDPRLANSVACLTQDVPSLLHVGDQTIEDLVRAAGIEIVQAARAGRFPTSRLDEARREVEKTRGVGLDISTWLNSRLPMRVPSLGSRPTHRELEDLCSASRIEIVGADAASTSSLFVAIDEDGQQLRLTALFDTALITSVEARAYLQAVERLLIQAVTEPKTPAREIVGAMGVARCAHGPGWALTDHSWIHLPTVTEDFRRAAGTPLADVYPVEAHCDEVRLIAYAPADTIVRGFADDSLEQLHRRCLGEIRSHRVSMTPHHYVLCTRVPARRAPELWREMPVVASGAGRCASTSG